MASTRNIKHVNNIRIVMQGSLDDVVVLSGKGAGRGGSPSTIADHAWSEHATKVDRIYGDAHRTSKICVINEIIRGYDRTWSTAAPAVYIGRTAAPTSTNNLEGRWGGWPPRGPAAQRGD
eukprot:53222-Pyramimonas_sp.AAC.1